MIAQNQLELADIFSKCKDIFESGIAKNYGA